MSELTAFPMAPSPSSVAAADNNQSLPLAATLPSLDRRTILAMPLHITAHPLIAHKLTLLRDKNTTHKDFRNLIHEITFFLGFEASRGLQVSDKVVVTPNNVNAHGKKITSDISIIPILRAGLGMANAMSELMPGASIHHIGMYRAKTSLLPVQYYNRLPKEASCDVAYIMDPCIATSNTIHAVVSIVKRWGAKKIIVISVVGSKDGVDKLLEKHPDIDVYISAVDSVLSESGMIIPGFGDAGDRQFGTPVDEIPDLLPDAVTTTSPSKKAKH